MFFSLTNRCRNKEAKERPSTAEIVEELKGMKRQVANFSLPDELIIEKPKNDNKKIIFM